MFRDPTYHRALREVVVPYLKTYASLKIWVAGCANGEEAYSLAIMLHEEGFLERTLIYATDINPESLRTAEKGVYETQLVFSDHSLATDSVFSEVHLVSCHNVLIYFEKGLQEHALGLLSDCAARVFSVSASRRRCGSRSTQRRSPRSWRTLGSTKRSRDEGPRSDREPGWRGGALPDPAGGRCGHRPSPGDGVFSEDARGRPAARRTFRSRARGAIRLRSPRTSARTRRLAGAARRADALDGAATSLPR